MPCAHCQMSQVEEPILATMLILDGLPTRLNIFSQHLCYRNENVHHASQITSLFSWDIEQVDGIWKLQLDCPTRVEFQSPHELAKEQKALITVMKRTRFHDLFKAAKTLGRGSFARVYLVLRAKDNKCFAAKAFPKLSLSQNPKNTQALQNQISIMRSLNHPNIVRIEGVYETTKTCYVVMQHLSGGDLATLLSKQRPVAPEKRMRIMKDILRGLAELERQGVIHRDIKPENIMIDANGSSKIVDFGLATKTQAHRHIFVRCGTPGYIAPEILAITDRENAEFTPKSDVFSAGVILYEMIFGAELFQAGDLAELLQKNKACQINLPPSCEFCEQTQSQLWLLKMMLKRHEEERIWASQALKCAYWGEGGKAMMGQGSEWKRKPGLMSSAQARRICNKN